MRVEEVLPFVVRLRWGLSPSVTSLATFYFYDPVTTGISTAAAAAAAASRTTRTTA